MTVCWCGPHDDFVAGCPAHDRTGMSADPTALRAELRDLRAAVLVVVQRMETVGEVATVVHVPFLHDAARELRKACEKP